MLLLRHKHPIKGLCALQVKSLQVQSEKAQQFSFEQISRLTWLQTDQVKFILGLKDKDTEYYKSEGKPQSGFSRENRAFGCSQPESSPLTD